ncbi:MAG TPA: carboxylating nicotinate-nucleotide diphosphorylase [Cryomorphaceae bacterium]|nr:carboxylating nicotinate-nucleotide diphosphorylase [Cryomorphaceae bacterium]
MKEDGIIAGIALAEYIFQKIDPTANFDAIAKDGQWVTAGCIVFTVEGNTIKLLQSERLVLNYMQRLSGVATKTHQMVQRITHTSSRLLDTRKTTPGLRVLEKWAVRLGGGYNHRMGLHDMVILKDNHIDFAGGIGPAVAKVRQYLKEQQKELAVEVETRNIQEVKEALTVQVNRIMLDNFDISATKEAIALIGGRCEVESSGGITEHTLVSFAECGVDYISVGALTHHIKALDMSLKAY